MVAKPAVTVDLSPAVVNIVGVRAGDKNEMFMNLTDDGSPYDLTGATLTAQARLKKTDMGAPAIAAVITVIGDPIYGKVSIRWPGTAVATLLGSSAEWNGVWDLQEVETGVDPTTIVGGSFNAVQDVTR